MFPLPRVVMAMAEDGLIFRKLGEVHEKTKTPVIATMVMSTLAAFLAAIFDIKVSKRVKKNDEVKKRLN